MAKNKTIFVCSNCGYESPKWLGKCPSCNEWNTFYEEKVLSSTATSGSSNRKKEISKPVELNKIEGTKELKISTGFGELDRVLGRRIGKWFFSSTGGRAWNWKIYFNFTDM